MPIYPVKSGSGSFKNSPKLNIKHNFHAVETPLSEINSHDLKEDTLIENNFKNRAKIKISKMTDTIKLFIISPCKLCLLDRFFPW